MFELTWLSAGIAAIIVIAALAYACIVVGARSEDDGA
jgi:hypothetical protein